MQYFQTESLFEYFSEGLIKTVKSSLIRHDVTNVSLHRNDEHAIIIKLTYDGFVFSDSDTSPRGTPMVVDDIIEFEHFDGIVSVAKGVLFLGSISTSNYNKRSETIETYSAASIELDFKRDQNRSYTIEWIDNLRSSFSWPEQTKCEENGNFFHNIGRGDEKITLHRPTRRSGTTFAMHLMIQDVHIYILRGFSNEKKWQHGQIIYNECKTEEFRKRIRNCLSFILGIPIIYYGYTDYFEDWTPAYMKSVDAFSIDGLMFKLNDEPPYPLTAESGRHDGELLNYMVGALINNYDQINFGYLCWAYWHARCAPLHTRAVYIGGLIEQLQRHSGMSKDTLLNCCSFGEIRSAVYKALDNMLIDTKVKKILSGKISNLNQSPAGLKLKRLFDKKSLSLGEPEEKAWSQRNASAHGGLGDSVIKTYLNVELLRIIFHRLISAISGCSDKYIDYYNIDYPVRSLAEAVPERIPE